MDLDGRAPITFGTLIGSLLLIGRWPGAYWRTRTTLLSLMNTVDLGTFVMDHAEVFGLPLAFAGRGGDGLAFAISHAMGLIELLLFASLAAEVSEHLGWPDAEAVARVARLTASISMMLWIMVTIQQLDWRGGFPPRFMRWRMETFLMFLGSLAAQALSSLFVTILCGHACIQCSRVLKDIERERKEDDPFRSRSEWP